MNNKIIAIIAVIVIIAAIVGILQMTARSQTGSSIGATANVIAATGDVFEGIITNTKVVLGVLDGVGVYDRSCKSIGNGLTKCDAGIQTEEYGTLNFNYVHNMALKPCIAPGESVRIEILGSNGAAKVQRY